MKKVLVIGGGISGIISAIILVRNGIACDVIEKKNYPFHRVCGEYISNETVPFLKSLNLFPSHFDPPLISKLTLSSVRGKTATIDLDLGGFGISRYAFDNFLFEEAKKIGVNFFQNTEVIGLSFNGEKFTIQTQVSDLEADLVIGAFGKRSRMDHELQRNFIKKRSPYIGVKYHLLSDHASNLIALHNFSGGYCGLNKVENGITNLCYLSHRDNLKKHKSIGEMETNVLHQNPLLKFIFSNSDFIFKKPETINEISFETKSPVENHVLMVGDAAGMITPLCGNGMAMAIHTAKLAGETAAKHLKAQKFSREALESEYTYLWKKNFAQRLWVGRQVQKLFGSDITSRVATDILLRAKPLAKYIIRNTHGEAF